MEQDPSLYAHHRAAQFEQRKLDFEIHYANLHEGKRPPTVRSHYGPARDKWLQNFARIPREQRTQAQWRKFEKYYKQIYGTTEQYGGEYD